MPTIWTDDDETQFDVTFAELGLVCSRTITAELIAVYRKYLADLDGGQACAALRSCCETTARFFPTVGEIREKSEAGAEHAKMRVENRERVRQKLNGKGIAFGGGETRDGVTVIATGEPYKIDRTGYTTSEALKTRRLGVGGSNG